MKKSIDIFSEISCLTESSPHLSGLVLQKKWFHSADKRIIGQYLQKFINYNIELFNFLGVQPFIIGLDQQASLCFRSSEFIGTIQESKLVILLLVPVLPAKKNLKITLKF